MKWKLKKKWYDKEGEKNLKIILLIKMKNQQKVKNDEKYRMNITCKEKKENKIVF